MLNLLLKDFKLLFAGKDSLKKNILSAIGNALLLAIFVVIEMFIFSTILKKLRTYSNATIPFLTFFLFIVSCIIILLDTVQANKLFFNDKDTQQLVSLCEYLATRPLLAVGLFCCRGILDLTYLAQRE